MVDCWSALMWYMIYCEHFLAVHVKWSIYAYLIKTDLKWIFNNQARQSTNSVTKNSKDKGSKEGTKSVSRSSSSMLERYVILLVENVTTILGGRKVFGSS